MLPYHLESYLFFEKNDERNVSFMENISYIGIIWTKNKFS